MKKITLTQFFDTKKETLVIHCDTEEKANKLLEAFDKLGETWCDDESYLSCNEYNDYKDKTCYSNDGGYGEYGSFENRLYKIYEFDEVDLEN